MPRVKEPTWKATSVHAAMASADTTAGFRAARGEGDPRSASAKWNHVAISRVMAERPSSAVVKPNPHSGKRFDQGTPKLETYHQPLTLAKDSAVMNRTTAVKTVRLRRDRSTCGATATAAKAPSAPASPANTPKWWVHLVGVNIIANRATTVTPMMTIGNHCLIGAGSVIAKDVPDNSFMFGNPARKVNNYLCKT